MRLAQLGLVAVGKSGRNANGELLFAWQTLALARSANGSLKCYDNKYYFPHSHSEPTVEQVIGKASNNYAWHTKNSQNPKQSENLHIKLLAT